MAYMNPREIKNADINDVLEHLIGNEEYEQAALIRDELLRRERVGLVVLNIQGRLHRVVKLSPQYIRRFREEMATRREATARQGDDSE
jgi:hypothetical protein